MQKINYQKILDELIGKLQKSEKNISTKEASESKGTRLQKENGYKVRQKDFIFKKKKRQKVFDCVSFVINGKKCNSFLPFLSLL